jgi:hypothetical protein
MNPEQIPEKGFPIVSVSIAFILLGLSVASGMYWWSLNNDLVLHEKISELYGQVENLQAANTASVAMALSQAPQNDELMLTRLQLAFLDGWSVRSFFRDDQNPKNFYFVTNTTNSSNVWVYDTDRDTAYQKDGTFNITEGSTLLHSKSIGENFEFKGVGIVENKFVFAEVSVKEKTESCESAWLGGNLKYIDTGTSKPAVNDFVVIDEMQKVEEEKVAACKAKMNSQTN